MNNNKYNKLLSEIEKVFNELDDMQELSESGDIKMNIEEAKQMVGTEFVHDYGNGEFVNAYVKAFDPEIGLTCYTLDTETSSGWMPVPGNADKDGTWCVIGFDFTIPSHTIEWSLEVLQEIKDTSRYVVPPYVAPGMANCAF